MIILGFHQGVFGKAMAVSGHDAGAALVIDGEIVVAVEEERFSRFKHTPYFPRDSITHCLNAAGIELAQVDRFCFPWSPELDRQNQARVGNVELMTLLGRHGLRSTVHAGLFDDFERNLGFVVPESRRRCLPHHLCHAASAFYCSPFEHAAFLITDAYGEMISVSSGIGRGTRLEPMEQTLLPTSLGTFYSSYTRMLGFLGTDDEYKVMGLAAYGDPARFRELFRAQWSLTHDGLVHGSDARARAAIVQLGQFRRLEGAPIEQHHRDLAAALQEATEDQLLALARRVRERTGEEFLCMAGGVALNSTANGKLARSGLFREVFIQPAASDAGTPLGAALLEHHRQVDQRRPSTFSAYLGPASPEAEIETACARYAAEIAVTRPVDVLGETVVRLRAQQILGWFQGRMEYGPRALGNRSILADPSDLAIRERINHAVKHREAFRPFAPSVLAEHAAACFDLSGVRESPFMLFTVPAKSPRRSGFEAAVHEDGTSRIQTVTRTQNPRFHALLEQFYEATGVPMLLNTSFNVNGEPIVCSAADAIESFLSTDLDALILGDRIIERRRLQPEELLRSYPCLQRGVELRASIGPATEGASPWRNAVVTRRHHRVELERNEVTVLVACNGEFTGQDLVDRLVPRAADSQKTHQFAALLERFLRLRLIRLLDQPPSGGRS
jgi:carbamoyltransferase